MIAPRRYLQEIVLSPGTVSLGDWAIPGTRLPGRCLGVLAFDRVPDVAARSGGGYFLRGAFGQRLRGEPAFILRKEEHEGDGHLGSRGLSGRHHDVLPDGAAFPGRETSGDRSGRVREIAPSRTKVRRFVKAHVGVGRSVPKSVS